MEAPPPRPPSAGPGSIGRGLPSLPPSTAPSTAWTDGPGDSPAPSSRGGGGGGGDRGTTADALSPDPAAGAGPVAPPIAAQPHPTLPPAERAARRTVLDAARLPLTALPTGEAFEIPGRPGLLYELRDYSSVVRAREDGREREREAERGAGMVRRAPPRPCARLVGRATEKEAHTHAARAHSPPTPPYTHTHTQPGPPGAAARGPGATDRRAGARAARDDLPFLFRAFEAGQVPPPRPGTKKAAEVRAATIHEYLDWTLTAEASPADAGGGAAFADAEDLDFGGFRAVVLIPRFRPGWPPPGAYEAEGPPPSAPALGAPLRPLPLLMPAGKPICAAAVRAAPGYLEVPFFATAEARRNRGYGRALLECIEAIARALGLPRLLLCATDDPITRGTWLSLGFAFTTDDDLGAWGVKPGDLMHMDNTVQMHRAVPPPPVVRAVKVVHGSLVQRVYASVGGGGGGGGGTGGGGGGARGEAGQQNGGGGGRCGARH